MIEYINAIKRSLIDHYGFPENPEKPGCVLGDVPDGVYPMNLEGKTDYVEIKDGLIRCGNFEKPTHAKANR